MIVHKVALKEESGVFGLAHKLIPLLFMACLEFLYRKWIGYHVRWFAKKVYK
jgi:hypothetical protein